MKKLSLLDLSGLGGVGFGSKERPGLSDNKQECTLCSNPDVKRWIKRNGMWNDGRCPLYCETKNGQTFCVSRQDCTAVPAEPGFSIPECPIRSRFMVESPVK